jgi:hypothetical protein
MLAQEPVEGADQRLVLAQADERSVAAQRVRAGHRQRHSRLARIAEDELAGLDGPSLPGQRVDPAPLDGGLTDRVPVAQRVEVARLGAEVLRHQHRDPGEPLILLLRHLHRVAPGLLGVTEHADHDVNRAAAEGLVPVLGGVRPVVPQLVGARRHTHPERLGKGSERVLRQAQRHQPGIADGGRDPGLTGLPPLRGGVDVRGQPAHELAAGPGIVHVQHDVRAVVRLGPITQHRRLDVVELHGDRAARKVTAEAVDQCHGALLTGTEMSRPTGAVWRTSPEFPTSDATPTDCPGS